MRRPCSVISWSPRSPFADRVYADALVRHPQGRRGQHGHVGRSRKACNGGEFTILNHQPVNNPSGISSYIGQIRLSVQAAPSTSAATAEPAAVRKSAFSTQNAGCRTQQTVDRSQNSARRRQEGQKTGGQETGRWGNDPNGAFVPGGPRTVNHGRPICPLLQLRRSALPSSHTGRRKSLRTLALSPELRRSVHFELVPCTRTLGGQSRGVRRLSSTRAGVALHLGCRAAPRNLVHPYLRQNPQQVGYL